MTHPEIERRKFAQIMILKDVLDGIKNGPRPSEASSHQSYIMGFEVATEAAIRQIEYRIAWLERFGDARGNF